jgi:hypothetical protein
MKYNNKNAQTDLLKNLYDIEEEFEDTEFNPEVIDYDKLEQGEAPVIDEVEALNYVADDFEDDVVVEDAEEYTPPIDVDDDVPRFGNTANALNWAVANNKVLRINYVTEKGADITRIVEPHALITPNTGNLIVVTYDRSVRNIRAFIVNNILNYIFTGNEFRERIRVQPSEKRKMSMKNNNIFENLKKIGDELEEKKLIKSADIVTGSMKKMLDIKTAQYVGLQGYWIRNRRCWDNCYRHKRTSSPEKAAQVVWTECWEEYKKSINDDNSGWEKYASVKKAEWDINDPKEREKRCPECGGEYDLDNSCSKCDRKKQNLHPSFSSVNKEWNKHFAESVSGKISKGADIGEAIYKTLEEKSKKQADSLLDITNELTDLSGVLKNNGLNEIGEKLAKVSLDIIKEADFGGDWWQKALNFFRTPQGRVAKRLKYLINRINEMMKLIQSQKWGSSDRIVKKADDQWFNPLAGKTFPGSDVNTPQSNTPQSNTPQSNTPQSNTNTVLQNISNEYHKFISDTREEMAILSEIATKDPNSRPLINNTLTAMRQFISSSDAAFQQKGGFSPRDVLTGLSTLLQNVVNVENQIEQQAGIDLDGKQEGETSTDSDGKQEGETSTDFNVISQKVEANKALTDQEYMAITDLSSRAGKFRKQPKADF